MMAVSDDVYTILLSKNIVEHKTSIR